MTEKGKTEEIRAKNSNSSDGRPRRGHLLLRGLIADGRLLVERVRFLEVIEGGQR